MKLGLSLAIKISLERISQQIIWKMAYNLKDEVTGSKTRVMVKDWKILAKKRFEIFAWGELLAIMHQGWSKAVKNGILGEKQLEQEF